MVMNQRGNKSVPLLRSNPDRWVADWLTSEGVKEEQSFTFGSPGADYETSQEALAAARNKQAAMKFPASDTVKRERVKQAYDSSNDLSQVAQQLQLTIPDTIKLLKELNIKRNSPGYFAPKIQLTGEQCKKARTYLDLSHSELSNIANVSVGAIRKFEGNNSNPHRATLVKLNRFFANRKIVFLDNGSDFQHLDKTKPIAISHKGSASDDIKEVVANQILKLIEFYGWSLNNKELGVFNDGHYIESLIVDHLDKLSLEWLIDLADKAGLEIKFDIKIPSFKKTIEQ